MAFTLRPGVFFNWIDAGVSPVGISTSIGGIAMQSDRGPLTPTPINDYDEAVEYYGKGNPSRGFGHETVKAFFRTAEACMVQRVPGSGARYASAQVANNYYVGAVTTFNPSGLYYDGTAVTKMAGTTMDYTLYNPDSVDIIFSGDFIATNTFTVTINGEPTSAVTFATDHFNTMRLIAQAIQTRIDSLGADGTVKVIERAGYDPLNPSAVRSRTIRIIGPHNVDLTVTSATLGGATPPTAIIRDTEWLGYILSENPGDWANNIGVNFSALNAGRSMISRILVGGQMAAQHSFTYTINGVTQAVAAAADNNTLLANVATSINTNVPNVMATVTAVTGANANREIILTAANPNVDINISFVSVVQNGGATPPIVTTKVISNAFVPDEDFSFNIYEYPDMRVPNRIYRATFKEVSNPNGVQTNLAYQINSGSDKSKLIRFYVNPAAVTNGWRVQGETRLNYITGEGFLGGGANGALPTSSEMISGWNAFEDTSRYTVRILMNGGYTTQDVHSAIRLLCEKRRDCVGILDLASAAQTSQSAAVQARYDSNIDSSYVSIFTPDIDILDTDRNVRRYSPPSGYIGALYAFTDKTKKEHWSPAGLNRGHIPEARGLRYYYKDGDVSAFYAAQINPIINYQGKRIVLFGDWTMQYKTSPMQFIGTRRMCNTIEIVATQTVAYSLFEPNTRATRAEIIRISDMILDDYVTSGGIRRKKVVDMTKPAHIDRRQAYFRYIIDPVTSLHQIIIEGLLTRAESSFNEYIVDGNQGYGLSS